MFDDQKVDAIGIRYGEVTHGSRELKGKYPVVVFTEQGLTGANLEKSRQVVPGGNSLGHQISQACFAIDRSGSMDYPLEPGSSVKKMEHLVSETNSLIQTDLLAPIGSNLGLVSFNHEATRAEFSDLRALVDEIAILPVGGNTNFSAAFKLVLEYLSTNPGARKLFVFATDGIDGGKRDQALQLAKLIRDTNASSIVVGIGADYNIRNIVNIASELGCAGWTHLPQVTNDGQSQVATLFGDLVKNLSGSDYYVEVKANGLSGKFDYWGLLPSICPVAENVLHVGYSTKGRGISFVSDPRQLELVLRSGAHIDDSSATSAKIDIIPADQAGAYFEQLQFGQNAITQVLLFRAKLEHDAAALRELAEQHPDLRPDIEDFIENGIQGDPEDARTMLTQHASISLTGASMSGRGWPNAGRTGELHSGAIGPLNQSYVGALPPAINPDPKDYDRVVPQNHARLCYRDPTTKQNQEFDLALLVPDEAVVLGRDRSCDIVLSNSQVSARHCKIVESTDGVQFTIEDLRSTNGTIVNDKKIDRPTILNDGDKIIIGAHVMITFHRSS